MPINQLQIPGYQVQPAADFSSLANLPNVIQKAQQDRLRQQTLANLGQGGAVDAQTLIRSGDLSLAQLGIGLQNTEYQHGRDSKNDARSASNDAFSHGIQSAQLELAKRAASRADEDKPLFKEISRPDGTTEIYRIQKDGTASRVDTGASAPINPATNPKNPFVAAQLKADAERVGTYSDASKLAEEGTATLDQIDALRKQAWTAPILGPLAAKAGHPATQALAGAANTLALDVAQKMKGSLSDKDIAFVSTQVPAAAIGGAAGDAASGLIRAGFERTKQRGQFYRNWAEQNGNINGADAAWTKYITENPLTIEDENALGGRKYNPKYNRDFSGYVRRQGSQTQGGITQAQYNALPSGATFTAPDGTQRVKP